MGPNGILVNASALGKGFLSEVTLVILAQRFQIHYRSGRHEAIPHSRTNDPSTCTRSAGMFVGRFPSRCVFGMSSGN